MKVTTTVFSVVCLFLGFLGYCNGSGFTVDPATNAITDTYGRTRIFHGVNAVYKIPPWSPGTEEWDPLTSLNAQDIANLRKWGFNAVRLGVMWPGVTPSAGYVNTTYLDVMQEITIQLWNSNITTLVDLHQDLLTRGFCGEGAPAFAIDLLGHEPSFPEPIRKSIPRDPDGNPNLTACHQDASFGFAEWYTTFDVGRAFQALYTNTTIQGYWLDHWNAVARTFVGQAGILGYELINEPWLGSEWDDPKVLIPGYTEKQYLQPLYDLAFSSISAIDNDTLIFFEGCPITEATGGVFDHGPGGSANVARQVFSYHIYCPDVTTGGAPKSQTLCNDFDIMATDRYNKEKKNLGGAGFLTEFGALDSTDASMEELDRITGLADTHFQSWMYWAFKPFNDITTANGDNTEGFYYPNGTIQANKLAHLSRTYATAIAGAFNDMWYNPANATFFVSFTTTKAIQYQTSEIYVNDATRQNMQVTISPCASWAWDPTNTWVFVNTENCGDLNVVDVLIYGSGSASTKA